MESKLFPYIHNTWAASNHWSVLSVFNTPTLVTPSAPWGHQPYEDVSLMSAITLMKASASGCPSRLSSLPFPMTNIMETDRHKTCRQPVSSLSTNVVTVKRQLTHGYIVYLFFFHISCPLFHNLVDFKLTDLWSPVKLLFWAQRNGKIIW